MHALPEWGLCAGQLCRKLLLNADLAVTDRSNTADSFYPFSSCMPDVLAPCSPWRPCDNLLNTLLLSNLACRKPASSSLLPFPCHDNTKAAQKSLVQNMAKVCEHQSLNLLLWAYA